ncbi:MAG: MoaD/ThiS family protein [Gammaproteobacteria bacterium]|nr:MoaD/ThiS family protein [Gammaproteobacteria bacterium]
MVRVVFPDHLLQHTGGEREIELLAGNFRELLLALDERWPGIEAVLTRCAVAIDGQIYQDAYLEPLQNDSEIFFMQRIEGG